MCSKGRAISNRSWELLLVRDLSPWLLRRSSRKINLYEPGGEDDVTSRTL